MGLAKDTAGSPTSSPTVRESPAPGPTATSHEHAGVIKPEESDLAMASHLPSPSSSGTPDEGGFLQWHTALKSWWTLY